jgi:hypothetical protein
MHRRFLFSHASDLARSSAVIKFMVPSDQTSSLLLHHGYIHLAPWYFAFVGNLQYIAEITFK